ncbi:ANTAR domain-containing response regulator [Terrisporobacter sp.]
MEKILVVSSFSKSKQLLMDMVKDCGSYEIWNVNSSLECREIIKKINFDLIIINSPLKDDYKYNLSNFISQNTYSGIILIVKDNSINEIDKFEEKGIYILERPLNKLVFMKVIKSHIIHRRRYISLIKENEELKNKIKDMKLIERAKLTLIQYLKMSEEESHKYIEKQAMNMRITKVEVAKNILKIYEF